MQEFLTNNQMYIVLSIVLLIWMGIVIYLLKLDKRIKKLEESMKRG